VLAIGAFLFSRRRKKAKAAVLVSAAASQVAAGLPNAAVAIEAGSSPGQSLERRMEDQIAEREALQRQMDDQALAALKLAPVITKKAEVFAKHLREKIAKEPEISIQILRSWIREEEM
jgi:hypothetical protein